MGAKISDEFTAAPVSRQRKYQLRKMKAGRCVICGGPIGKSKSKRRCPLHQEQEKRLKREWRAEAKRRGIQ